MNYPWKSFQQNNGLELLLSGGFDYTRLQLMSAIEVFRNIGIKGAFKNYERREMTAPR